MGIVMLSAGAVVLCIAGLLFAMFRGGGDDPSKKGPDATKDGSETPTKIPDVKLKPIKKDPFGSLGQNAGESDGGSSGGSSSGGSSSGGSSSGGSSSGGSSSGGSSSGGSSGGDGGSSSGGASSGGSSSGGGNGGTARKDPPPRQDPPKAKKAVRRIPYSPIPSKQRTMEKLEEKIVHEALSMGGDDYDKFRDTLVNMGGAAVPALLNAFMELGDLSDDEKAGHGNFIHSILLDITKLDPEKAPTYQPGPSSTPAGLRKGRKQWFEWYWASKK